LAETLEFFCIFHKLFNICPLFIFGRQKVVPPELHNLQHLRSDQPFRRKHRRGDNEISHCIQTEFLFFFLFSPFFFSVLRVLAVDDSKKRKVGVVEKKEREARKEDLSSSFSFLFSFSFSFSFTSLPSTMVKIRAGVVGFGLSATVFHIPFLLDNPAFELVAIVDRSGTQSALAHPLPVKILRSFDSLLELGEDLDLVVISTPPDTHFPLALASLKAGKHVVVEKPLCTSSQQAEELERVAKESGRVLAAFQNRRFDSDFLTVKDLVASQVLGELVEYEAHYDRFRPALKDGGNTWKEAGDLPGTGLLYDLGSHLIDQALHLFGTPLSVTGSVMRQRPATKIDDAFHVVLRYPTLTVSLKAGMLLCAPRPRFALYGLKGSFVKFGVDVQEPQLRSGMKLTDAGFAEEPEEQRGTHTFVDEKTGETSHKIVPTRPGDYRQFYARLAEAITSGGETPVSAASVANVIRVIEMAYQSNKELRSVPWN